MAVPQGGLRNFAKAKELIEFLEKKNPAAAERMRLKFGEKLQDDYQANKCLAKLVPSYDEKCEILDRESSRNEERKALLKAVKAEKAARLKRKEEKAAKAKKAQEEKENPSHTMQAQLKAKVTLS